MDRRDQDDWARQRKRAIAAHAADQRQRSAAEARQAVALIASFVATAHEQGIAAHRLVARPHRGWGHYRTGLHGWYLKSDHSLAVGTDGNLYLLTVLPSLRARMAGVQLTPAQPRLVIGAGGRDGESIPLAVLLERRLSDAGAQLP
ncbi:hypothetical protein [Micromonospora sp. LOL_023]|uniref:hypothetical protein n=1 Tax=Micromonospora sp. LOL_023 TaxID=3345418 RepID=UPI003A865635